MAKVEFSLVSAVNNEAVLQECLLNSPGIQSASAVILKRGFRNAAAAYNSALAESPTDIVVFVHQDVYLPLNWDQKLSTSLSALAAQDPDWGVAGVWGVDSSGKGAGHIFCVGLGRELGQSFPAGVQVRTLDEVLLIVRRSSGVRFDLALQGYHFYGSDLCLEAERLGKKCYAIASLCVHNTNGYKFLPWSFWRTYLWMRRKWRDRLPIVTPCANITFTCWPMIHWNLGKIKSILLGRDRPGKRVSNAAALYARQIRQSEG